MRKVRLALQLHIIDCPIAVICGRDKYLYKLWKLFRSSIDIIVIIHRVEYIRISRGNTCRHIDNQEISQNLKTLLLILSCIGGLSLSSTAYSSQSWSCWIWNASCRRIWGGRGSMDAAPSDVGSAPQAPWWCGHSPHIHTPLICVVCTRNNE